MNAKINAEMSADRSMSVDGDGVCWWQSPWVWLVLAGPISVIVACIATLFFILQQPDGLVAEDYYQQGLKLSQKKASSAAEQPAMKARNHAATGG
jgi:hypothetical protein